MDDRTPEVDRGPVRRTVAILAARPLLTVTIVSAVVVAFQVWWLRGHRPLGTFDTDEAGYMATALRFHRNLVDDGPGALLSRAADSSTGPLVPLLSVPLMAIGSRSVASVLAVQPMLQAVTAIAATGVARRLGTARQALVAGIVTLGLPALVLAGRSYQLVGGACAGIGLAVWALLASERGRRALPMVGLGAAVGAMLLSRAMTVVYLPGLGLAVLFLVPLTRRTLTRLAAAAATAALVAAPWWISAWSPINDYLFRYGYGDRSAAYGPGSPLPRVLRRASALFVDLMPVLALTAIVTAVLLVAAAARGPGSRTERLREVLKRRSPSVAVAVVIAVSWLLLLTSSNAGKWFELPLVALSVPLLVTAAGRLPPEQRSALAGVAVGAAVLHVAIVGTWAPIRAISEDPYGRYELLAQADPRIAAGTGERAEAGDGWWAAHRGLVRAIDAAAGDRPAEQVVTGSSALLNGNSLLLAEELTDAQYGPLRELDSTDASAAAELTDRAPRDAQVLVVLRARSSPFPPDTRRDELLSVALGAGWQVRDRIPLPDGGDALVLVLGAD